MDSSSYYPNKQVHYPGLGYSETHGYHPPNDEFNSLGYSDGRAAYTAKSDEPQLLESPVYPNKMLNSVDDFNQMEIGSNNIVPYNPYNNIVPYNPYNNIVPYNPYNNVIPFDPYNNVIPFDSYTDVFYDLPDNASNDLLYDATANPLYYATYNSPSYNEISYKKQYSDSVYDDQSPNYLLYDDGGYDTLPTNKPDNNIRYNNLYYGNQ